MHVLTTQCHISQADLLSIIDYFAWNLRVVWVEKTLLRPYERIIYGVRGPLKHSHTRVGVWGTLQQQWMHVLMKQHQIAQADLLSVIGYFCLKFESSLGRKATAFTMRGSNMVAKSFYIILIHIREVREHSSSNECMSLRHSVIFPRLICCP